MPSPDWETDYGGVAVLYKREAVLTINRAGIIAKAMRWESSPELKAVSAAIPPPS